MGMWFQTAFVSMAEGFAPVKKRLTAHMKSLGYRASGSLESADVVFRIWRRRKTQWFSMDCELMERDEEFLPQLADALGVPVISAMNADSDCLALTLMNGGEAQTVVVGDGETYGLQADAERGIWHALLDDAEKIRAFEAVVQGESLFSEDALREIALLIGLDGNVLEAAMIGGESLELQQEFAPAEVVLIPFSRKDRMKEPLMLPDDMPPAFEFFLASYGNPTHVDFASVGGAGKGVIAEFRAHGYDPDEYEMPYLEFAAYYNDWPEEEYPMFMQRCWKGTPERCVFDDGVKGWRAVAPEVPFEAGVNMKNPKWTEITADRYRMAHRVALWLGIRGDAYPDGAKTVVRLRSMQNPEAYGEWGGRALSLQPWNVTDDWRWSHTAELNGKYVVQNAPGMHYYLKEAYPLPFLERYRRVTEAFSWQTSGNICFTALENANPESGRFIKFAGAPTLKGCVPPEKAVANLKKAAQVYRDLRHENLVELLDAEEVDGGYALIFRQEFSMQEFDRYFAGVPLGVRVKMFGDVMAFLAHTAEKGYVAIDFYQGSIMYSVWEKRAVVCDVDLFEKAPYVNSMGRMYGSSRFMSPEEYVKGAVIDEVTNVYTLGATAFAMLADFDRSREAWPLGDESYEAARRAVSDERALRQQSIRQFVQEWQEAMKLGEIRSE